MKKLQPRIPEVDEKAFKIIFDKHFDRIYGVAFSFLKSTETANDAVQEIFIKLWMKRELLPTIKNLDAYLYQIAKNHILNEFRKKIYEVEFKDQVMEYLTDSSHTPYMELSYKELNQLIGIAVKKLPHQQELVYRLSREENFSRKEIAMKLGISENTVRSHLNRALRFMRHFLFVNTRIIIFILGTALHVYSNWKLLLNKWL